MFSVCRQSSHIFQVTRGMYCTNNKVFLSQENAYMGTFQWILRNEGWFLYVSYSHLVPLVDLPCRNCTSSSTYFIQNPWTCTVQQNTFWSLGAMLRLTTCRRPVLLQAKLFFLFICGLLAVLLGTVVISGSLGYPLWSVMLKLTVFFSSIFVSMVENIILRLLDGSLRRLVSKFKVQTSSQPNRWVYVSEIFILSFFFSFFSSFINEPLKFFKPTILFPLGN